MLRLTRLAVLMAFAIFLTTDLTAQQNATQDRQQGDYNFGFNGGVAYQQSDVATNLSGLGFGLTYGKNLIYAPHSPFSLDIRSRFQVSQSFGTDIRPSLGIANNEALNGEKTLDYTGEPGGNLVYANHKTNHAEVGMEGVLTLNGLRETTGLGISFTGGVGLGWYQTKIDQMDTNGLYADGYSRVDAGGAKPFNLSQLETIRDGKYETLADGFSRVGKFGIMPSLGIELDYDLTNNLALGVGHRMTFSGTDLLDGQQWTNANTLTGNNDLLHYTSLGLKYRFNQKNTPKKNRQPTIELIEPYGSGLSTTKPVVPIQATINRVNNPFDIYLTINGEEQRFNFNNNKLVGQIRLKRGENKIVITANNAAGTTKKIIFLTYKADLVDNSEVIDFGSPEIIFTTPAYDNEKTTENRIKVSAKVRLVDDRRAIALRLNGKKQNFDFNKGIAVLDATVNLREGTNTIEIKAKNRNGEQLVTRTIYKELPIQFPTVNFTSPAYNNATVDNRLATVKVNLQHIAQSTAIQLFVNGQNEPNFYFDYTTGALKADIQLREGRNEIEVVATNERGKARDQRTIIYERPYIPTVRRPRVTINAPQYQSSTTREELVVIHATLENIIRKSDIRLTNNGLAIYDFDFNPNTSILRHNLYLRPGINQVVIEAQNEAGRADAKAVINFEVPLPPPPVVIIPIPTVAIYTPRQNDVFEEREITVKANLSGVINKRDIEFRVNREDCLDFRFNPTNGNFRAKVKLRAGENVIVIKATNPSGNDRQRITVFYEKPYAPIIDLRRSKFATTEQQTLKLKATVEHIENKRAIQLFLNNRVVSNYRFRNNELTATLSLKEGNNQVKIVASNKHGETQEAWNVEYYAPQPPSITINNIADNQTFKTNRIELTATIQNIANKQAVKLFVNGVSTNNYRLEGNDFTTAIRLKEGRNTVILKVNNDYGKDEVNLQLNYLRPRKATINFISHDNKVEVKESKVTVSARVKHISNKADIELTINNKTTDFAFDGAIVKSRIRLKKGRNIIRLVAHTDNGNTEKVLTLNYQPIIHKPTIQFVSTTKSLKRTQHMQATISALVKNVGSKNDLTLVVNGKPFTNFDFDNGKLKATIALKIGSNSIQLSAKNEGGITEQTTTITRVTGRPTISKGGEIGKDTKISKRSAVLTKSKPKAKS